MTKKELVSSHLAMYGSITSLDAIRMYNATRLSAIIFELKKDGKRFDTKKVKIADKYGNSAWYAQYNLLP